MSKITAMAKTTTSKKATNTGRLVNISMSNHSFQVLEGEFFKTIKLGPYQATREEFDLDDKRIKGMLTRPNPGPEVRNNPALRQRKILFVAPKPGTEITEFTAMGGKYSTCAYAGSVEDGTKQMHPYPLTHSVRQAQEHLISLSNLARIEEYLRIDERPFVQSFGRDLLHYRRTNLERAEKGLEPLRGKQAITQSVNNGFRLDLKL